MLQPFYIILSEKKINRAINNKMQNKRYGMFGKEISKIFETIFKPDKPVGEGLKKLRRNPEFIVSIAFFCFLPVVLTAYLTPGANLVLLITISAILSLLIAYKYIVRRINYNKVVKSADNYQNAREFYRHNSKRYTNDMKSAIGELLSDVFEQRIKLKVPEKDGLEKMELSFYQHRNNFDQIAKRVGEIYKTVIPDALSSNEYRHIEQTVTNTIEASSYSHREEDLLYVLAISLGVPMFNPNLGRDTIVEGIAKKLVKDEGGESSIEDKKDLVNKQVSQYISQARHDSTLSLDVSLEYALMHIRANVVMEESVEDMMRTVLVRRIAKMDWHKVQGALLSYEHKGDYKALKHKLCKEDFCKMDHDDALQRLYAIDVTDLTMIYVALSHSMNKKPLLSLWGTSKAVTSKSLGVDNDLGHISKLRNSKEIESENSLFKR